TEIDWSTYVQQVQCFLNGTLDYNAIKGDTGPIVYPAGHLYIYTILYYLTNRGTNILCAQYIFAFIYLITLLAVFRVYHKMDSKIDWSTYVQQVQCFLNGTLDYNAIKGDTGPIVYPAGHLYIYTILYYLTNRGTNILCAQYIFAFIYLITLLAVFRIYHKMDSKLPPFAFVVMCCTSYRIHSIYILRLFNDTIAMALLYIAINFFIDRKWTVGSVFYSIAVSVKMNVLLFAPALLLLLLETNHIRNTIINLSVCALIQLALGLPFLLSYPKAYILNSFNFGRVFLHKWTVNWRFVTNEVFVSQYFHITLLALHLLILLLFFKKRYFKWHKWLPVVKQTSIALSNDQILLTLFTANFIGIAFSRSLHYQFYVWYFHSLPFLLWTTSYSPKTKLCILGLIELSWNTYPSTQLSSGLLHVVHLIILIGLWKNTPI
ncbi:unnamed protein product, partial [Oppiella nova]